jgi:hypothetical protein
MTLNALSEEQSPSRFAIVLKSCKFPVLSATSIANRTLKSKLINVWFSITDLSTKDA